MWAAQTGVLKAFWKDFEKVALKEFYSVAKMAFVVDNMLVDWMEFVLVDSKGNTLEFWWVEWKVGTLAVLMVELTGRKDSPTVEL